MTVIVDAQILQRVEHEVAQILAETEAPVEVYAATLEAIGRALGWELGAVWETGPEDRRLRCVRTWHAGDGAPEFEALSERLTLEAGEGLPGRVLLTGEPAWIVDTPTDPALYRRVAEKLPEAFLEDPDLTVPEAAAALEPHRDRITWDAPIHGVADIEKLAFLPRTINVKPSRIGTWRELLRTYEWCDERDITCYGGGQSELGVGRGQIQYLASIFHASSPNDIAPSGYDWPDFPETGLPPSPLPPELEPTGFRRRS